MKSSLSLTFFNPNSKYLRSGLAEVFDDFSYLPHAQKLAQGILNLQLENGEFMHVLHYPSLQVKERFRIIYYYGEAAFALMRLYRLDKQQKWIDAVEKAFDHFIEKDYWKNHDHWLSYCTNELTAYAIFIQGNPLHQKTFYVRLGIAGGTEGIPSKVR